MNFLQRWWYSLSGAQEADLELMQAIKNEVFKSSAINARINAHFETMDMRAQQLEKLVSHTRSLLRIGVDAGHPAYKGPGSGTYIIVAAKGMKEGDDYVNVFEIQYEHWEQLKKILKDFADIRSKVAVDYPRGFPYPRF